MKKRIYAFTIDDDEYSSEDISNNVKAIASLMHEEIKNIDCDNPNPILVHSKKLFYNQLYESCTLDGYVYSFESEKGNRDYTLYEPLMINNRTFGITINDNSVSMYDLVLMLDKILKELGLCYQFSVVDKSYLCANNDDESKRILAIREINKSLGYKINSGNNQPKKLVRVIPKLKMIRG